MTREEMICGNIGLVHSCARRFRDRGIEYDDLFQTGCLGLAKAVDGFDPTRGLQFSTYAVPVILGELRRLFREGGAVKVSRSLKELSLQVSRRREQLAAELGREPTVGELAEALSRTPEEIAEALMAGLPPLSLTRESGEEEGEEMAVPTAAPQEALTERMALRQVLDTLPPRDRALILLRYVGNNTQTVTAARLGMTQVQVSRCEHKILERLRRQLTG